MKAAGASACTDITGFGLFAHLRRMLRQSKLGAEIFADALPAFDGAMDALRQGVIPGAIERNRKYVGDGLQLAPGVDEAAVNLGFDAQTSGGLLIAIAPERLESLRQSLATRGAGNFVIGKIVAGEAGKVFLSPAEYSKSNPDIHPQKNDLTKKFSRPRRRLLRGRFPKQICGQLRCRIAKGVWRADSFGAVRRRAG
jgi:hypothetical protein